MVLRPKWTWSACAMLQVEARKWNAHLGSLAHRSCSCSSTVGCCSRRKILARRLARSLRLFGVTVGVDGVCSGRGSAAGAVAGAVAGALGSVGLADAEDIGGAEVVGTTPAFILLISTAVEPIGGCDIPAVLADLETLPKCRWKFAMRPGMAVNQFALGSTMLATGIWAAASSPLILRTRSLFLRCWRSRRTMALVMVSGQYPSGRTLDLQTGQRELFRRRKGSTHSGW